MGAVDWIAPPAAEAPVPAPRPYQEQALQAIIAGRQRGLQRVLLTLPTGTGKTNVFVWLMERLNLTRPALVLAHRDELIRQAADRIAALAPGARIGIEKAEERAAPGSEVVVASVQTIGRKGSARLEWLAACGPELIVCDEAHHAPADSYLRVFERFGAFTPGGAFLVGVTATPHRLDSRSMARVFEEEVYRYELQAALQDGWLCPIRCYRVLSDTDISRVGIRQGDFEIGALSHAVNTEERTRRAIAHWQEVAGGRRTLAFCVDVAHAHATATLFREAGVTAEAVDGSMSMPERQAILARLRSGETRVICNCQVLTEGFDCPNVAAILLLRPTQSGPLYTQMAGRGTRLAAGKVDLVLIDVVDNSTRHNLITAPVLLGLPSNIDMGGESLLEMAGVVEALGAGASVLQTERVVTADELKTRVEAWDLFAQIELPAELQRQTSLAWAPVPSGFYLACGGNRREARLHRDMLGVWHLHLIEDHTALANIPLRDDLASSLQYADCRVLTLWPEGRNLIDASSPWRRAVPTDKQIQLMQRKGIAPNLCERLTRGEAARLIARLMYSPVIQSERREQVHGR